MEQALDWQTLPFVERQWMLREFRQRAGMPVDAWLETLGRLGRELVADPVESSRRPSTSWPPSTITWATSPSGTCRIRRGARTSSAESAVGLRTSGGSPTCCSRRTWSWRASSPAGDGPGPCRGRCRPARPACGAGLDRTRPPGRVTGGFVTARWGALALDRNQGAGHAQCMVGYPPLIDAKRCQST